MSLELAEQELLYDNPCAPIVKFSSNLSDNGDFDDEETNEDQEICLNTTLGEHSFKSMSLEDLVKSFDTTINTCFNESPIEPIELIEEKIPTEVDPVASSKSWSELIENLRASLRQDLKLPNISESCQTALKSLSKHDDYSEITSIDDLNEEEEEELREQLDMHSVIISNQHEPFLTAEQVISEIDFMLQDMTPDSGYCDDQSNSDLTDLTSRPGKSLSSSGFNDEFDWKRQTIYALNDYYEELNQSIKDLSSLLVQELAIRDELEFEKETKNTFISLVLSIQNKRRNNLNEKRSKRRSLLGSINPIQKGTFLTTVIPYDRDHPTHLSVEHLQNLNKILQAINDDSRQVPELLTKYILNVLCPC